MKLLVLARLISVGEISSGFLRPAKAQWLSNAITLIASGNPCARLMLIAVHATRCQDSASQDVGMAECQDSSQLRVTYITNDCGPVEQE
ncbi:hypothetical protein K0M31_012515 [Melipona bicolor]|uniref:Uncharacterized protein n=1 Tax=Melipona bicolor TaxID=60889 RepID=A0AA40FK03_9HYME|nr:hypothetical protein K0M31_012515 [Melipona bicolor]